MHNLLKKLRAVPFWLLVVLLVGSVLMSVSLLRKNNLRMVALRDAVVAADANNGDVEAALQALRQYVGAHMNTNLRSHSKFATDEPPIQLVNRYNKAVQAAQEQQAQANGNRGLYNEAEANCKTRSVPLTAIAQCIQDYITARTSATNPQPVPVIPKELYTFDFVSPKWSPDLAGWSVFLSGVLGVMLLFRFAIDKAVSHLLKED